jgi:hypothetical protein
MATSNLTDAQSYTESFEGYFDNGSEDDAHDPLAPVRLMGLSGAVPRLGTAEYLGFTNALDLGLWTRQQAAEQLQRQQNPGPLAFDNGNEDDGSDPLAREVLHTLRLLGRLPDEGSRHHAMYEQLLSSGELTRSQLAQTLLGLPITGGRSRVVPASRDAVRAAAEGRGTSAGRRAPALLELLDDSGDQPAVPNKPPK